MPPQPHLATPHHDALAPTTRAPYSKGDPGLESDDAVSTTMGPSVTRRSCHKDDSAGLEVALLLERDALVLTMTAPNSKSELLLETAPGSKQDPRLENNAVAPKTMASASRRRHHLEDDGATSQTTMPSLRRHPRLEHDDAVLKTALLFRTRRPGSRDNGAAPMTAAWASRRRCHPKDDGAEAKTAPPPQTRLPGAQDEDGNLGLEKTTVTWGSIRRQHPHLECHSLGFETTAPS
jgi:hypothetical protein